MLHDIAPELAYAHFLWSYGHFQLAVSPFLPIATRLAFVSVTDERIEKEEEKDRQIEIANPRTKQKKKKIIII